MTMLSGPERRLLEFAETAFGVPLSDLLLFGYASDGLAQVWRFVITLGDVAGSRSWRYLKVTADERFDAPRALPCGKEPLVLVAILKLLFEGDSILGAEISFTREDILSLLGWADTVESQAAIDGAIDKYFNTTYQPVETLEEILGQELIGFIRQERLVTSHGLAEEAGESPLRRREYRVRFNPDLIHHSERRLLFGIDWQLVESVMSVFDEKSEVRPN